MLIDNPIIGYFPNAVALLPAALLYLFDGAILYTKAPWAHARGLPLRRLRLSAAEGAPPLDEGWLASRARLGVTCLSDGTWSTWSPVGYGAAYNGLFANLPTSRKCVGVVMTTILDAHDDGDVDVATSLRIGPMLCAAVLPICFMRTTLPLPIAWALLPFALASLLGPGLYAWSYRRNARHTASLIEDLEQHLASRGSAAPPR